MNEPVLSTIRPEADDIIVCAFGNELSAERAATIKAQLSEEFPGHRCLVICGGTLDARSRWTAFTDYERSDIHNALLHAVEGTGTGPGLVDEIREFWKRYDAERERTP